MIQQTSREANEDMESTGAKQNHKNRILNAMLSKNSEGNYEALARLCGLTPQQVEKRLSEMVRDNTIEDSGKTSMLSSGKMGIVWRVKTAKQEQPKQPELF